MADVIQEVRTRFRYEGSSGGLREQVAGAKALKHELTSVDSMFARIRDRERSAAAQSRRAHVEMKRQLKDREFAARRARLAEATAARRRHVQLERERRLQERLERIQRRRARINAGGRRAFGFAGGILGGIGRGIASPLGILGLGGLVTGAGYALKSLLEFRAGIEDTEISIAALLRSADKGQGAFSHFGTAMDTSRRLLALMKEQAKTTPGTFQDIAESFRVIYMPVRNTGASPRAAVDLAANISAREKLMPGAVSGTLARDVRQMLMGIGSITQIQTPELQEILTEVKKLVKGGRRAEAVKKITAALALSADERNALGESFHGKLNTLIDQARDFAQVFADPVFDAVKGKFAEWSEHLSNNREHALKMAEIYGKKLLTGLTNVAGALGTIATTIGDIASGIGTVTNAIGDFFGLFGDTGLAGVGDIIGGINEDPGAASKSGFRFGQGVRALAKELPVFQAMPSLRQLATGIAAGGNAAQSAVFGAIGLGGVGGNVNDLLDAVGLGDTKPLIDARGSKITVYQRIDTEDPNRIAAPILEDTLVALVRRPVEATVTLANGGR